MNLTIDIGNTWVKLGLFDGDQLVKNWRWEHFSEEEIIELATNQNVKNVILSTVAEALSKEMENYLEKNFFFVQLSADMPLPIKNLYRKPETLGKDRLAAVVGAFQLYPGEVCLVIDAGTCITYDLLSAGGSYLGGNISPGVDMRLKAMHAFTARLPLARRGEMGNWIGNSTETALRNGGQVGAILEMQAFIEFCRHEFGQINVILTGGDAIFFVKSLKSKIFVNYNLVLCGLNKILNYNVERLE